VNDAITVSMIVVKVFILCSSIRFGLFGGAYSVTLPIGIWKTA